MATITNDIVTNFAFNGSVAPLTQFNASMGGTIKLLAATAAGVAAVVGGVFAFTKSVAANKDALTQLSRNTGVAVETISELGFAADVSGSSADAMQATIESLSQKIGEAATRGSEDFARLGLSVRDASGQLKSADQVLLEFSDRIKRGDLSRGQAIDFASRLGIDKSLIQLLSKSRAEIAALRKEAEGLFTKAEADALADYNDQLKRTRAGFDALKIDVAVGLLPIVNSFANAISEFALDHGPAIQRAIAGIVEFVSELAAAIVRLLPTIGIMIGMFALWKIATLGLTGVMAALGTVMAVVFSPVVLITAGIAALLLVVDDLIVAFQGGQSVIASFFKDTFDIDIVSGITAAFDVMKASLSTLLGPLEAVWGWYKDIIALSASAIGGVIDFVTGGSDPVPAAATGFAGVGSSGQVINITQNVSADVRANDVQGAATALNDTLNAQLEDGATQFGRGAR